jgi:hypothetical protein
MPKQSPLKKEKSESRLLYPCFVMETIGVQIHQPIGFEKTDGFISFLLQNMLKSLN